MSDALLSPNYLQNSDVFQELISSQIGDNNSPLGMQEIQHPNVAVYLRVSTGDQTVEAQKLRLTSLLAVEGYDINQCMLYIDDGVSAKRKPAFTDRPEGSRMMQDVSDGKITKIYGTYVNRFFRRVSQGAMWLDEMKDTYPNVIIKTSDVLQILTHRQVA
jgi:DNA invertase Pin-like site-specific DNA recombinase